MGSFRTAFWTRIARLRVRWRRFSSSRRGRRVLWGARHTLTLGILGYLVYRMSVIGWAEIARSLPHTPWFYAVFLGLYLTLPVFHALAFGLIWRRRPTGLLPATLKKRVYDKDVLNRSGDVYVYFWGRAHLDRSDRTLLHHVKDNAITSAVASTLLAVVLLTVFLALGRVPVPAAVAQHGWVYGGGGLVVLVAIGAAGLRFRHRVFLVPARTAGLLLGVHSARVLVAKTLLVTEWAVALPAVATNVWVVFLAVQIVTSRLPLVPSRDLLFMAAGIELAGAVAAPEAAIAGLLGVHSVLDKAVNLAVFAGVSAWEQDVAGRAPDVLGTPATADSDPELKETTAEAPPPGSASESSPVP